MHLWSFTLPGICVGKCDGVQATVTRFDWFYDDGEIKAKLMGKNPFTISSYSVDVKLAQQNALS